MILTDSVCLIEISSLKIYLYNNDANTYVYFHFSRTTLIRILRLFYNIRFVGF